jgi:MOSC domain-containing protein YiiM
LSVGTVTSVNVGAPRVVEWHGRLVETAIWKAPVAGRVAVSGVNLAGDRQADLRVHGGHDKAVYTYAAEDYRWWEDQLGVELAPGTFGENVTTSGVDLAAIEPGERWRFGTALLEARDPRQPCFKLGIRMGDAAFVDRFKQAERLGRYFAIVDPGDVGADDQVVRLP